MNHHQAQDHEMLIILARLELVSHGKCATWNGSGHSDDWDPLKAGELNPPHLIYRTAYLKAGDDTHRRDTVIDEARTELRRILVGPRVEITPESPHDFDMRARKLRKQGWTVAEVAQEMKCTPTRIRRAEAGDDAHDRVLELAGEGKPVRVIAIMVSVPKSTVHRWITERAA